MKTRNFIFAATVGALGIMGLYGAGASSIWLYQDIQNTKELEALQKVANSLTIPGNAEKMNAAFHATGKGPYAVEIDGKKCAIDLHTYPTTPDSHNIACADLSAAP